MVISLISSCSCWIVSPRKFSLSLTRHGREITHFLATSMNNVTTVSTSPNQATTSKFLTIACVTC